MSNTPEIAIRLGSEARREGRIREAIQHYREAENIYRHRPDPLRLAHTIRHIGDIFREAGSLEEARPYYEEALKIYREHEDAPRLDLANAIRGFALLRGGTGESEEAMNMWREARSLYASLNVQPGVQESDAQIELLSRSQGNGRASP